ncbi:otolin-1-like [Sycon ciliatum]|uniref:otolin-1-like n=1 Tax=Sycon ciliatum TaxID=27933 RepID=UPI0031F60DAA
MAGTHPATQYLMAAVALLLLLVGGRVHARTVGAPYGACDTMMPSHGANPTSGNPGYSFSHNMCQGYQRNTLYDIIVRGPVFKGFFCRVQRKGSTVARDAVGEWDPRHLPSFTRQSSCSPPSSGVTQLSTETPWSELRFKWRSPSTDRGVLQITCTIVHTYTVFYPTMRSGDIHYNPTATTSPVRCGSPSVYLVAKPPAVRTPQPAPSNTGNGGGGGGATCTQTCPAGPRGPPGSTGATGPAGTNGARGYPGRAGATGAQGLRGYGIKGAAGSTGPAGPRGATGLRGYAGPAGNRGSKGERGVAGPRGPPGYSGTVTGGTSQVSVPGPRGQKGEPGNAGRPGANGRAGGVGRRGQQGARGQKGDTGTTGRVGRPGVSGLRGPEGPPGPPGGAASIAGPSTEALQQRVAALSTSVDNIQTETETLVSRAEMEKQLGAVKESLSAMKEVIRSLELKVRPRPVPDCPEVRCGPPPAPSVDSAVPQGCQCRSRFGVENGTILDRQMSASSYIAGGEAHEARLHTGEAWIPRTVKGSYLQIDFGKEKSITGVIVQGKYKSTYWTVSYAVHVLGVDNTWSPLTENGAPKMCEGNTDSSTAVICVLDCTNPVQTSALRILPQTYNNYVAMRVEIMGCSGSTILA